MKKEPLQVKTTLAPKEKGNFLDFLNLKTSRKTEPVSESLELDEKKTSLLFLIGLGLASAAVVALIGGGVMVYQGALGKMEEQKTISLAEEKTSIVEEDLEEDEEMVVPDTNQLVREELRIEVLNGAGVAGTASRAKEFLVSLGYDQIEVGNADNFNYQETEIFVKDGDEDLFEFLSTDLSVQYQVKDEVLALEEDEVEGLDALIIVGRLEAQ